MLAAFIAQVKFLSSLLFLPLPFLVAPLAAHDDGSHGHGDALKAVQVTERIYMIPGEGCGNIGLAVDDEYTLLIDDQFAKLSDSILAAIREVTDKPIAYLLNTHYHFDHTEGNVNFSDEVGVIVAHDKVRERLASGGELKFFGMTLEPMDAAGLPALTFNDSITIHQAGETIEIVHFPEAHTDGDSVIFFKDSNVVHTGDLYFSGFYPFIDVEAGGDVHGFLDAMAKVISMIDDETKIIPGHGPLSNKTDMLRDHGLLSALVREVELAYSNGAKPEEIATMPILRPFDEALGGGFLSTEKFVSIVCADLAKD